MDKRVLIEYSDIREEIKELRRRIEKMRMEISTLNETVVTDSVSCGKKGKKPIRTVKIQGRPIKYITKRQETLEKLIEQMERKELELLELTIQAEEYIESMKKSELRMIFRMCFLDDLPYYKIAEKMNKSFPNREIAYTDENIRKKIQRFFENVPKCPGKMC